VSARERGFTLVEVLVATALAGILAVVVASLLQVWAAAVARQAAREARRANEADMRRLYEIVRARGPREGAFPSAGPWPAAVPSRTPVPWERPAPGFDELGWAPSRSPVLVQYRLEGWATGFVISALGDLDRDGQLEWYRLHGDLGMLEGPLPPPPAESSPL
jgi:prepilin-type N-terminal cleavage/methylation domain-containing protein